MTGVVGALLAGLAGALVVGGLTVAVWASRKTHPLAQPRPGRPSRFRWWAAIPVRRRIAAAVALLAGVAVGVVTGWLIAALVLPAAVLGLPALLLVSDEGRTIRRLEAMAEWTRNLASVLTAGQGIEAAIQASLRSAPEAIRPEVARLVARLRARWSTEAALRGFADDLNDATGDLVCAALILGSSRRGDGLARVLTGLSESVAEDVRARRQVEADRAKPRTTARTVTVLSLVALAVLGMVGPFLAPYGTPLGQLLLGVLLAGYTGCVVWLRRLSIVPAPARFLPSTPGGGR